MMHAKVFNLLFYIYISVCSFTCKFYYFVLFVWFRNYEKEYDKNFYMVNLQVLYLQKSKIFNLLQHNEINFEMF